MSPLAFVKAAAVIALGIALEVGFLLQISIPPDEILQAQRAAAAHAVLARTPAPAPAMAEASGTPSGSPRS